MLVGYARVSTQKQNLDLQKDALDNDGSLTLPQAVAGTTDHPGNEQGTTPLDLGISPNGQFLYNVLPGSGRVAGWRINSDGGLTKLGEFGGVPPTVNGNR
jgi:hypothetical protein